VSQRVSSVLHPRARSPLQTFRQAVSFHEQGRLWEAEQLYEIVLKTEDRHFDAVYRLGLIRVHQNKFSDAAHLFRRAIKIDKNSADAHFHLGVALTGLGQVARAVQRYESALALKPVFPEAHNNLGYALQLLGRHEQAAAHYEKALAIVPAYAEARCNLANALQILARPEDAIAQYEKALALKPNYAEAHGNLGNVLEELDRHEEAIAHYEKALALRPNSADTRHSLGKALGRVSRFDEAIAHFDKALAIEPNHVEARAALANLLHTLGRSEEAVAHCKQVLALKSDNLQTLNTLGVALRVLGKLDEAIEAFERAIVLSPRNAGTHLNLTGSRRITAADPHFTAMRTLAADMASLKTDDQIALHFALGKAFADVGDPQQSSWHLLQGNSLKRRQITYDEAKTAERFERIRRVFTAELVHEKHGFGDPSLVPVFIIGMPRSGTTLIEQILASHPKVFGAGELPEIPKLAPSDSGPNGSGFPETVPTIPGERLRELGTSYLQSVQRMAPRAERVTDKLPANFEFAGFIHLILPNARLIHACRDPRDTALSCFSILFRGETLPYTYDLAELGYYYHAYQELMEHWRAVLPQGVMLEIEYEDVVDNLEDAARRIVAHCGLEWDDRCLAFYKNERSVHTASASQVRQPIYRGSVGRWRPYQTLLQPFLQSLKGS
jgi:tetratricopeptide (TPR) repeat protein